MIRMMSLSLALPIGVGVAAVCRSRSHTLSIHQGIFLPNINDRFFYNCNDSTNMTALLLACLFLEVYVFRDASLFVG